MDYNKNKSKVSNSKKIKSTIAIYMHTINNVVAKFMYQKWPMPRPFFIKIAVVLHSKFIYLCNRISFVLLSFLKERCTSWD